VSVAVKATQGFTWHGRDVSVGDVLIVRPVEAASLTYQRKASFLPAGTLVRECVAADAPVEAVERKRRTYRRRDLAVEP
jgi:hypothetical protein